MFAYKGTFDAATSTGNQDVTGIVDQDGNSFTPKAILVWGSATSASGFADGWKFQVGMSDATTTNSSETAADDNVAAQRARTLRSATRIVELIDSAGTVLRAGTLSSFSSGQFRINWTTVTANAEKFHFLALGGTDLSVLVSSNRSDQVSRTSAVTAIPSLAAIIMAGAYNATTSAISSSLGWATPKSDGTIPQNVAVAFVRDNVNPSQTKRYQRTTHLQSVFTGTGGTLVIDGVMDQLGIITTVAVADANLFHHSLLLGGISAKCGSGLQPTSTGTQAVTGVGFKPKCVIIASVGNTAQTSLQNEGRMCIGAADRTRQGYAIVGSNNGVTPSVSVSKYDTSKAIAAITPNATAASTTTDSEASIQSMDTDGFTLNWTTADATQREYVWLALGDAVAASSGQRSRAF